MTTVYNQSYVTVDVSTSSFLSDSFQLTRQIPAYVQFSASWDSTAAASACSFQGSVDGSTFADLYDANGNEITILGFQGRMVPLDPATFANLNYMNIRSGISSSGITQTAPRTIAVSLGRFLTDSGNSLSQTQPPVFGGRRTVFS